MDDKIKSVSLNEVVTLMNEPISLPGERLQPRSPKLKIFFCPTTRNVVQPS